MEVEPIQAQLEKILAGKTFAGSQQLRAFLRFTVETTMRGGGDTIKEYLVGVEVLGRKESFDPRTDNIVRAQASKLRAKLDAYYSTEGLDDPIVIEFPRGGYVPVFHARQQQPESRRSRPVRWIAVAISLVLLAATIYAVVARQRPVVRREDTISAVAVLPFVDMSQAKDQEYFCDGITEELINELAQIGGLRVVARTSSFAFKGKGQDIRKIGKQLNVGAVVEGSVRKSGDKLRVTAQLNNVADGYHLWSQTFDREMKDIFAIQQEISEAIARTLRVKLAADRRYPKDLEAYELYLQGRHQLNTSAAEGMKLAIGSFEQAVARDPGYAPAYAGLGESYYWLAMRSGAPPKEAFPKAKEAARKALAIDERSADAHSALAAALYSYDWDWPAAEMEFRRALELSPNHSAIHQIYARYLTSMARLDDALREIRRAEELDPLSLTVKNHAATILWLRREFDRSIEECRRMIAMDPANYQGYSTMGTALLGKHQDREAMEALSQGWELSAHRDPMALAWLAYAVGKTGDRAKLERLLGDLRDLSKQHYVRPIFMTHVYNAFGQTDEAFAWVERAMAERDAQVSFLQTDFRFDRFRADPRFASLMKRMQLR